jgi:hypothetical protein
MGRKLAHRAYLTLGIESLSELEHAAADGRLRKVAGFGPKRVVAVRDVLIARLRRGPRPAGAGEPAPIAELLDVDREYRERTDSGTLPMFAPRRFNPNGEAWMPVLHTVRGVRHYTGLYSNTALAHRLGRTRDWVVLYYDDSQGERQCTIVTAQRGPLTGLRIVRGREQQCVMHYHLNSRRAGLLVASSA